MLASKNMVYLQITYNINHVEAEGGGLSEPYPFRRECQGRSKKEIEFIHEQTNHTNIIPSVSQLSPIFVFFFLFMFLPFYSPFSYLIDLFFQQYVRVCLSVRASISASSEWKM